MSKVVKSQFLDGIKVSRWPYIKRYAKRMILCYIAFLATIFVVMNLIGRERLVGMFGFNADNIISVVLMYIFGGVGALYFIKLLYNISPGPAQRIAQAKAAVGVELAMISMGRTVFKYMDCSYSFDSSFTYVYGSAIAVDDKNIYIVENGILGIIPFSEIRSYTWNLQQADTYYRRGSGGIFSGKDITMDMENAALNAAERGKAHLNSGFILKVADVEHPEWRFACQDKAILNKWYEILNQISEGKFPG